LPALVAGTSPGRMHHPRLEQRSPGAGRARAATEWQRTARGHCLTGKWAKPSHHAWMMCCLAALCLCCVCAAPSTRLAGAFQGCVPGGYSFAVHNSSMPLPLTASIRISAAVYGGNGTYILMSCKTDGDNYRAAQVTYRSQDGGHTWSQRTVAGLSGRCRAGLVYVPASDTVYMIAGTTMHQTYGSNPYRFDRGQVASIWYTEDHGESWSQHGTTYPRSDGFLSAVAVDDTIFAAHGCCAYRRDVLKWTPGQAWSVATSDWGSALGARCCAALGLTADERVVVLDGDDQTRSYAKARDMWVSSGQGATPYSQLFASNMAPFVIDGSRMIPFSSSEWMLITRQSASQLAAWCTNDTGLTWHRVDSNGDGIAHLEPDTIMDPFFKGDIDYQRMQYWMYAGGSAQQTITLSFSLGEPETDTPPQTGLESGLQQVHCCMMLHNGTVIDCSQCARESIHTVDLSWRNITLVGPAALASMGGQVTSLDLSGNALHASTLLVLADAVGVGGALANVTVLNVSRCGLHALPAALPLPALAVLDASHNHIAALPRELYAAWWCGDGTASHLCVLLQGNPAMQQGAACPPHSRRHALPEVEQGQAAATCHSSYSQVDGRPAADVCTTYAPCVRQAGASAPPPACLSPAAEECLAQAARACLAQHSMCVPLHPADLA